MKQINIKKNFENNVNILHSETLQTLCALQYYMSTLSDLKPEEKQRNYWLSFKTMQNIVDTLIKTVSIKNDINIEYPLDLVLIHKNLENIQNRLAYIQ